MIPPTHADLYDLARHLISSQIGRLSQQRREERSRLSSTTAVAEIEVRIDELLAEREALSITDRSSLEESIRRYARSSKGAECAIESINEFYRST